jgi:NH3-dependent NAD+ synthetase
MSQVLTSLLNLLRALPGATVAFSGGVDSAVLLAAARRALGGKVLAVTLYSSCHPAWERREASDLAGNSASAFGGRKRLVAIRFLATRRRAISVKSGCSPTVRHRPPVGLPTVVRQQHRRSETMSGPAALEAAAARSPVHRMRHR